jgi:glycosyltransferase involved in cell wall biosynthesis
MSRRLMALIPALDAEKTLEPVVHGVLGFIDDLIVVDDGSSDATSAVARAAGARVIRHPENRGKGAALKSGFERALAEGFDAVLTLDADGQHLPGEIPRLIDAWTATEADLVIGSRAHLFAGMLGRRRGANRFSAWAISKAAGVKVGDSQSGFRIYSARLLRTLPMKANGFDAESEVIVRAGRSGMPILSVPIELGFVDGISTSHYRPVADTLRIAWTVAKTRLAP